MSGGLDTVSRYKKEDLADLAHAGNMVRTVDLGLCLWVSPLSSCIHACGREDDSPAKQLSVRTDLCFLLDQVGPSLTLTACSDVTTCVGLV